MTPITPPLPLDVLELFPDLAGHAATATRLHPRPGAPTIADSSIGGPLLWPADEPWPVCEDGGHHYVFQLSTPAAVHRSRAIIAGASGELNDLTGQDLGHLIEQPISLVPVAQLYRRDIPDYTGPGDTDLLQVLWCPLDHPEEGYNPRPRVYWRRTADITSPLSTAPEPLVVRDDYLPAPCVVHPEQVVEYPYPDLLPEDLQALVTASEEDEDDDEVIGYFEVSQAPGFKVGGHANWSLTDPAPMDCAECGTPMTLLFTAASSERNGRECVWAPSEDTPFTPTGITIGRGYSLYVFRCPASFGHPTATAMQ
ncbi:hypothetical protein Ait01nite_039570 [Actinoplanes italicus]|uniref:DUF1963 domain-containing protein n=1 Tax=Actinoplanes italicus TaxID=113567 RepID=A0A2T0JWC9_9ACTN|nr:hypothetical protein [Actinoplanes italicus]PRX12018.1 hypothetical protein CLV67_13043 [Actinoplanes italicus]GIE30912.1 hypothetical protein Ait01nite_039570 [Actinoplanes italicus]